jgi:hypothetical protein
VIGTPAWTPFDAQGFMAYRLAMMTFASTSFLSVWALTRRLAGERAAWLAVLLGVTTPFLVHEIWFTWPKLLAASFVLMAALRLLDRRWISAGVFVGVGYLVHPLVLLSIPALLLLALWPLRGMELLRPRIVPANRHARRHGRVPGRLEAVQRLALQPGRLPRLRDAGRVDEHGPRTAGDARHVAFGPVGPRSPL